MAQDGGIAVRIGGSGGVGLTGTPQLVATAGDRPAPAVLLVRGSGPRDRDGNQPPALIADIIGQIAVTLAGFGIASLRCDKRGMAPAGRSCRTGRPAVTATLHGWFTGLGRASPPL